MLAQNLHNLTQSMKRVFTTIAPLNSKTNNMETKTVQSSSSNMFLTGTIFLANLDFAGLADYAFKAALGGAIWLGYKLAGDYIDRKRSNKK